MSLTSKVIFYYSLRHLSLLLSLVAHELDFLTRPFVFISGSVMLYLRLCHCYQYKHIRARKYTGVVPRFLVSFPWTGKPCFILDSWEGTVI